MSIRGLRPTRSKVRDCRLTFQLIIHLLTDEQHYGKKLEATILSISTHRDNSFPVNSLGKTRYLRSQLYAALADSFNCHGPAQRRVGFLISAHRTKETKTKRLRRQHLSCSR